MRFEVLNWEILEAGHRLCFHFHCSVYGAFRETITLPKAISIDVATSSEFDRLAWLLGSMLAISYYKLKPSGNIYIHTALEAPERALILAAYREGLGEFYARNELSYPPQINIETRSANPVKLRASFKSRAQSNGPVVAFGGGKDSNVSLEIIKRLGQPAVPVSVVLSSKTQDKLAAMYSDEIIFIKRALDPKLFELNARPETLNGHVPITAINSLILSIYALCNGHDQVVFSNERGSSQYTRLYQNEEINHQFSKGLAFEKMLGTAIARASRKSVAYFSLLRPFSEIWIGKAFSQLCHSEWQNMASCNKNFIFSHDGGLSQGERWCGSCSKCLYTALIIAPFVSEPDFLSIFDHDMFGDVSNVKTIRALAGLSGEKPWECVGDIVDTRAILHLLTHDERWSGKAALIAVKDELDALQTLGSSKAHIAKELSTHGPHFVPTELFEKVAAFVS